MIKLALKHFIYEACIDRIFDGIYNNFIFPKIAERFKEAGIIFSPYIPTMFTDIELTIDMDEFRRMNEIPSKTFIREYNHD